MHTRRFGPTVVVLGVAMLAALAISFPAAASGVGPATQVEEPTTDNTVTHIHVHADGSAHWTVRIRTRLETEESVNSYETFQEDFRANRSAYLEGFRGPIESIVAAAAEATGRDMAARNFSAETSIRTVPRRWGIVSYEFTWDGFARTDGDRLQVGDAFESGFFIAENDTLQLSVPEGYELSNVEPSPDERDNGTAIWQGRVDFGEGNPSATMEPAATLPAGGVPLPLVLALVAILVVVGVVGYRRATGEAEKGSAAETGGANAGGGTVSAPAPVTDEERLQQLLSEHGGRMRQAEIVEEVEWSKSKVSRLLDDLVEEGIVEKTRLGRENVVSLVQDDGNGSED